MFTRRRRRGGVPARRGGFQRQGGFQRRLPAPRQATGKRRRQRGLLACNDRQRELFGCRGLRLVRNGQSGRPAVAEGEGKRVCSL